MWTVVRIIRQMPLLQQRRHLLRRQRIAGPHRGMASHQTEQVVKELLARRHLVLAAQLAGVRRAARSGRAQTEGRSAWAATAGRAWGTRAAAAAGSERSAPG